MNWWKLPDVPHLEAGLVWWIVGLPGSKVLGSMANVCLQPTGYLRPLSKMPRPLLMQIALNQSLLSSIR